MSELDSIDTRFKDTYSLDPQAKSRLQRNFLLKKSQDLDLVIQTCSKKLESDPRNLKALYTRGSSFFKKGLLEEAINDLNKVLQVDPRHQDSLYIRGIANSKIGHFEQAELDLSDLLRLNPNHVNAVFARANCYSQMGKLNEAIEDYNLALFKDNNAQNSPKEEPFNSSSLSLNGSVNYGSARRPSMSSVTSGFESPFVKSMTPYSNDNNYPFSPTNSSVNSEAKAKRMDSIDVSGIFSLYDHNSTSKQKSLLKSNYNTSDNNSVDYNQESSNQDTSEHIPLRLRTNSNDTSFTLKSSYSQLSSSSNPSGSTASTQGNVSSSANSSYVYNKPYGKGPNGFTFKSLNEIKQAQVNGTATLNRTQSFVDNQYPEPTPNLVIGKDFSINLTKIEQEYRQLRQQILQLTQQEDLTATQQAEDCHSLGFIARKQNNFTEAIEFYTRGLSFKPLHLKSLFNRGYAHDKLQQYESAIEDYTLALFIDPNNVYGFYNRGITFDHMGLYREALYDFTQAITLATNTTNQKHFQTQNLIDFYQNRGYICKKLNQYPDAIQDYSIIINLILKHTNPSYGDISSYDLTTLPSNIPTTFTTQLFKALFNRSLCQTTIQAFNFAVQDIQLALQLEPHHLPSLLHRATLHFQIQQHTLALQDCQIALELGGDKIMIFYLMSKIYVTLKDYQNSVKILSQLLELLSSQRENFSGNISSQQPNYYEILTTRSILYKENEEYLLGIHDLEQLADYYRIQIKSIESKESVTTLPSNNTIHVIGQAITSIFNLGFCFRKVNQLNNALSVYQEIVSICFPRFQVLLSNNLSSRDTLLTFKQSLQTNLIKAYNNRAFIYAKLMQNKEAIDDYSMVIEVDPLNAHAYHNRGILYDKLGMIDQALSDFTKVFELDSKQFGTSLSPEERAAVLSSLGKQQQPQQSQQQQPQQTQYSQPHTQQSQQNIQANQPNYQQSPYQLSNYQAPAAKILQPKQIQSTSSDQSSSGYSPVMSNTLPTQPSTTNLLPPPAIRISLPPQNISPPQNPSSNNTPGIRTTNSMPVNNNMNIPLYNGSMSSNQNLAPPPVIRPAIARPSSLPPSTTTLNTANPAAIAASTAANTQYNATIGGVKIVLPSSSSSSAYQPSNTNEDKGSNKAISSLDDKLDNMSKMLQSFGTNTSNSNTSVDNSNPLARIKPPPLSGMMQRRLSQQQSQQTSQP